MAQSHPAVFFPPPFHFFPGVIDTQRFSVVLLPGPFVATDVTCDPTDPSKYQLAFSTPVAGTHSVSVFNAGQIGTTVAMTVVPATITPATTTVLVDPLAPVEGILLDTVAGNELAFGVVARDVYLNKVCTARFHWTGPVERGLAE